MPSSAMMALMVLQDLPKGQLREGVVAMVVNPTPNNAMVYVYDSFELLKKGAGDGTTPIPGLTIEWYCVCKKRLWMFYRTRLGNGLVLCKLPDGSVGRLGIELNNSWLEVHPGSKEKL